MQQKHVVFLQYNQLTKITQTEVLYYLRAVAHAIGKDKLGFDPLEIEYKSIRSDTVIGWHLAHIGMCYGQRQENIIFD